MRDICKAYKSLVTKWHPDNHPSNTSQAQQNLAAINQAFKALNDRMSKDEEATTTPQVGYEQKGKDDSFFTKRNSFLSRTKTNTSSSSSRRRRSKTPTPTTTSTSYSRSRTNSMSTNFPISPETSQSSTPTSVSYSPAFGSSPKGLGSTPLANSPTSPWEEDPFAAPLNISSPTLIGSTLSHSRRTKSSSETDSFSSTFFSRSASRIVGCSTPIVFSQSTERRKPPPIERKLECTLEELCSGCVKKIKLTRDVITPSGIVQEDETVKIRIQAGWKKGTKIRFEGKGDEKPGFLPADIIFVIEEKRHSLFKRIAGSADDLEMGIEIPLVQALTGGCPISVPLLLGGEMTNISMDDQVIYSGYQHVIPGQGMLNSKQGRRGDLRIKFVVQFPSELADERRCQAHEILKDCCYS